MISNPVSSVKNDVRENSAALPPNITSGWVHAYFIYDVADVIDLTKVQSVGGVNYGREQLELGTLGSPGQLKFLTPPAVAKLSDLTLGEQHFEARVKVYDYGTISVRLSVRYSGNWAGFSQLNRDIRHSESLRVCADSLLDRVQQQIGSAFNRQHEPLVEDYFIAEIRSLQSAVTASDVLLRYRSFLASLLLGELEPLTCLEEEEALRQSFSYFESDLAIVHWDGALVFDERDGAEAVESILEFANTQLVELRTYDALLDADLDAIYKWDLARARPHWLWGRRAAEKQVDKLRCLVVDIRELTDRANNALKITGDAYYARIYRGVALRLGLTEWQEQMERKLESVGEIYQFATDRAQHARSEFLELIIIVLICFEIALGLLSAGQYKSF